MTVKSNFQLDKRIKSIDDIQTIISNNRGSIDCKGFFFDNFVQAKVLTKTHYGTLVDIDVVDQDDHCFKARDENGNDFVGYYRFFIPEDALKPDEKQYRPYKNAQELFEDIGVYIGDTIHFRSKAEGTESHSLITSYTTLKDGTEKICLGGAFYYTMQALFDLFELRSRGEWIPFGKECVECENEN